MNTSSTRIFSATYWRSRSVGGAPSIPYSGRYGQRRCWACPLCKIPLQKPRQR